MKKTHNLFNQKGITLVALVVTIVVLLILAGISINLILGQNGIIAKAKESKDKTASASALEKINLAIGEATLDGLGELSIDKLEAALAKQFGDGKATVVEKDGEYIITIDGKEQYIIEKDGQPSEYKEDKNPGTPEEIATDTFEINSIEDLIAVSYSVNKGEDTYQGKTIELGRSLNFESNLSYGDPEAKYTIEVDPESTTTEIGYKPDETGTSIKELLLGDTGYIPIGICESAGFYGTLNGNNKVIKNMKVTQKTTFGGLIGKSKEGTAEVETTLNVSNLGVENANIEVPAFAGAIIGRTYNTSKIKISNCHSSGKLTSLGAPSGGIIGNINNDIASEVAIEISDCDSKGEVKAPGSPIGGIIGNISNNNSQEATIAITNCHSTGNIAGEWAVLGGIVGAISNSSLSNEGTIRISNCENTGNITSTSSPSGGIVGMIGNDNC